MKVLVVDDERNWRNRNRELLTEMGHRVVLADSRWSALQQLQEHKFDAVLTDGKMEEGDSGVKLAADVKSRWPHIKVVFVATYFPVEKSNFDAVIDKMAREWYPVEFRAVIDRLFPTESLSK